MKKLLPLLALTIIIASCKKSDDEYYTISGLVLDMDAKTPITSAKVYAGNSFYLPSDSAVTDVNGRVSFRFRKDGTLVQMRPAKDNYVRPFLFILQQPANKNRTDTVYLGRPSFVNLTMHKTGAYLPQDSIELNVRNHYADGIFRDIYSYHSRDKADTPDKSFNLNSFYALPAAATNPPRIVNVPPVTKLYFQWQIIRNGNIIDTKTDSTELIQFGTKNYQLNY